MHCETFNIQKPAEPSTSEAARAGLLSVRGEPLFLADWLRPVFVHYEVPADALQSHFPFEIDLFEGKAYVSLVAFTMQRMRPFHGGRLTAWVLKPIARNDFLNFRAYVRHNGEPGIYFLTEWMNNPLSVHLGPMTFGLPYNFGITNYQNNHESGFLQGAVREKANEHSFAYQAELTHTESIPCPAGSLDEFLMERYTAFTSHGTKRRFFRIWHPPWHQQRIKISVTDTRLITAKWPWFRHARLVGGNYSPGAENVWMGRPHRIAM
ncbi:MAG TPA: DUF2071 domain-containing protein [Verrucomicrobiae bacterium]|nr:DUF2071 domain-containing protein [Verrucomicrobiae bacterium]